MENVAVGISGGVDSAVAASLLIEEGYDCWSNFYEKLGRRFRILPFRTRL